jgi:Cu-Zn family superoxide dismutase
MKQWAVIVAVMMLSASAWAETPAEAPAKDEPAAAQSAPATEPHRAAGKAVIAPTRENSKVRGVASLTETPEGLHIAVRIEGVAPRPHAIHIHQFGVCDDQGKAAGDHFNPSHAPHGYLPKDGLERAHGGDMGNIEVGRNGVGTLELVLPDVTLTGANGVAGRAIIIHEQADTFAQPSGNAGGRIACGPIVVSERIAPSAG